MKQFLLSEGEVVAIKNDILSKIKKRTSLNDDEKDIVKFLVELDEDNDYFPPSVTTPQIKTIIRMAYENAEKIGKRTRGRGKYQGRTKQFVIHFWFNFEDDILETAYPFSRIRKSDNE
jgi:hypothetical protein